MTFQPPAPGWYPTPYGMQYFDGYQWLPPQPPLHPGPQQLAYRDRVAAPLTGWLLLASGAIIAVGSFMPWATALGGVLSKSGIDGGDGWITVILGLAAVGLGLAAGMRKGLLPLMIIGALCSIGSAALAVYEMHDVHSRALTIGSGLVIILIAAGAGFVVSLVGTFARVIQ